MRRSDDHRAAPHEALVRQIWQEHSRAMLAYAVQVTGNRADAEDVVQETLIHAWRQAHHLSARQDSTRTWLLTVVQDIVAAHLRARPAGTRRADPEPTDVTALNDHAEQVVDAMLVAEGVRRLIPKHRVVIELIYLRGYSLADAADALGLSTETVKTRAYYALRALQGMYPDLPHSDSRRRPLVEDAESTVDRHVAGRCLRARPLPGRPAIRRVTGGRPGRSVTPPIPRRTPVDGGA
ncbi:sigma-70 family RNA polymerase sigma factor [Micromonospora fiedleri]|uniref:RNA polymerase sigma factor n=1 Tax=Micromonospora fiedleri TaxID=1157498 RepID=A0ABS1UTU0_9ACTN|nr:sigma-70 family RNA polymerase sigma factor [Micromonospora fiedleri]MBL6279234.1 sigma-70 family RNA polymerase sigma factor [Micromonospora fiedleri]